MLEKIAYNLGINNEEPNIKLSEELCSSEDKAGIKEIVNGLKDKNSQISSDCIKVLYEISYRKPKLVSEYVKTFIELLNSKNNRLVWGAMIAISKITEIVPDIVYENLDKIVKSYENGSVITIDNAISVFAELAKSKLEYESKTFSIIIKHLETCRPKEVGQHAERAFICVNSRNKDIFKNILLKRRDSLVDTQKKRVDKLLKKIENDL